MGYREIPASIAIPSGIGPVRHCHPVKECGPGKERYHETVTTRTIRASLAGVLTLCAGLSLLVSAQGPALTVLSREGRKPLPVTTINNQDYVAIDDLNAAFGTSALPPW